MSQTGKILDHNEAATTDSAVTDESSTPGGTAFLPFANSFDNAFLRTMESPSEAIKLRNVQRVLKAVPDNEDKSLAANAKARAAREAFLSACNATDVAYRENQYFACKDSLKALWKFAPVRSQSFRDLLAAVEAAICSTDFDAFSDTQRRLLLNALSHLTRPFISDSDVEGHIHQFVENDIDITAPLKPSPGGLRYKVTIEEII